MNLQLVSPYTKCPFHCPFCVAAVNEETSYSDELYYANQPEYFARLLDTIHTYNIKTVVITGDTEPTLFPEWIEKVLMTLGHVNVKIEIQTRNYKFKGDKRFDVVAYSFDKVPNEPIKSKAKQTRAVFINNTNLNLRELFNYKQTSKQQVTLKQMQKSAYCISDVDKYIESVYRPITNKEVLALVASNIRYDANCMDSKNRYIIFRCDGEVYETWEELPKKSS